MSVLCVRVFHVAFLTFCCWLQIYIRTNGHTDNGQTDGGGTRLTYLHSYGKDKYQRLWRWVFSRRRLQKQRAVRKTIIINTYSPVYRVLGTGTEYRVLGLRNSVWVWPTTDDNFRLGLESLEWGCNLCHLLLCHFIIIIQRSRNTFYLLPQPFAAHYFCSVL